MSSKITIMAGPSLFKVSPFAHDYDGAASIAASQALAELLHLRPDFPTAGPFLISCYGKFPYLVDGLLEGLRLAGLKT